MTAEREDRLSALASRWLGGKPSRMATPFVALASPSWRGVDAEIIRAERGEQAVMIKAWLPDTRFYIDTDHASRVTCAAAEHRLAPAVHEYAAEYPALVMEALGDEWRVARLEDVDESGTREAIFAAFKSLERLTTRPHCQWGCAAVDHQLGELLPQAASAGRFPATQLAHWRDFVARATAAIRAVGVDQRLIHGDANLSNLMLHDNGSVRLLDFDMAGLADPFQQLGCCLMEYCDSEATAREAFEQWCGYFDEREYQRAMVYAMLDDLRWGLIAQCLSDLSPRRYQEFGKYASWRLWRFSKWLEHDSAARLRAIGAAR
ncbi:phosphotransferase [Carnimonas bestiolae]|uniref:phosphotransferase n=1 Tax=Carnimonas bestiolae TaxID=3402172 RepID=UPI003EDC4BB6